MNQSDGAMQHAPPPNMIPAQGSRPPPNMVPAQQQHRAPAAAPPQPLRHLSGGPAPSTVLPSVPPLNAQVLASMRPQAPSMQRGFTKVWPVRGRVCEGGDSLHGEGFGGRTSLVSQARPPYKHLLPLCHPSQPQLDTLKNQIITFRK